MIATGHALLCWLCCLVVLAGAEPGGPRPAPDPDPLREELRRQDPPWYDGERDTWLRVEPRRKASSSDGLDFAAGGAGLVTALQVLLVFFVVGLLVLLLYWILRHVHPVAPPGPDGAPPTPRPRAELGALPFSQELDSDPEAGLKAAVERGDWRLAIIYLYASRLLFLDRRGILHLHPGTTDRGYLRALPADRRRLRRILRTTIESFERIYFGRQPADRNDFERLRADDGAFRADGEESGP